MEQGMRGYPPVQVTTTVVAPPTIFGENPMQVTCGNCRQTVVTTTMTENGACAYVAAVVVLLLCCPCFWIPLVMDSCKDVTHSCPACGAMLGQFKRM